MEGTFDVTRDGQVVGTARVKREGLYCRVSCRCRVADRAIHRLWAGNEKLGVLIPEKGELVLETKVAAKRLKPGCCFTIGENRGEFIPIRPGEAFYHLDRLRQGKLVYQNGQPGMKI